LMFGDAVLALHGGARTAARDTGHRCYGDRLSSLSIVAEGQIGGPE
jgi:hypothetical protein